MAKRNKDNLSEEAVSDQRDLDKELQDEQFHKMNLIEFEDVTHSKISTGSDWVKFSVIAAKPQAERVKELLNDLDITFERNSLARIVSIPNKINDYLETFEYVFHGLNDEFKVANLLKVFKKINTEFANFIEASGKLGQLSFYNSYSLHIKADMEPLGISVLNKIQELFIANFSYKGILEEIKINSSPDDTKNLIYSAIHNLPIESAQLWIDSLWEKTEHNLKNIPLKEMAENNQAVTYFLKSFEGWDNKNYLTVFFNCCYLGQNNLDYLYQKTGKISSQATDEIVDIIYKKKDISDSTKINIFKTFFTDLSANETIFNFMTENLSNGSNNRLKFEKEPFFLSKSIGHNMVNQVKDIVTLEKTIFSNAELEPFKKNILNPNTNLSEINNLQNQWLKDFLNKDEKEQLLINYFSQMIDTNITHKKSFFSLLDKWSTDIDKGKFINAAVSILQNHPCEKDRVFAYYYELSSLNKDPKIEDYLFNTVYKSVYKINELENNSYVDNKKDLFDKIIKSGHGIDFLSNFFEPKEYLSSRFSPSTKMEFFLGYMEHIKNNLPDTVIDLRVNNPLAIFSEKIYQYFSQDEANSYISYSLSNDAKNMMKKMLTTLSHDIFQDTLNTLKNSKGQTLEEYSEKFFDLIKARNPFASPSKSMLKFLNWSNKKEEQLLPFLVIKDNKISLEKEIIDVKLETSSDFVQKSQNEMKQVRSWLTSAVDKPYNLEVKIKSESLIMDYSAFVSLVDTAKDMISVEDMHFLQNNLGIYLLESLKVYDKALTRFEIMNKANEAGNFKKLFSGKSEQDIENFKEKIDAECLRQINLLEKQLELVKSNILEKFGDDSIKDMKIKTKFYSNKFPDVVENIDTRPNLVKIR